MNTQVFSFPEFASTDHLITKDFWTPKTNSGPRSHEAITNHWAGLCNHELLVLLAKAGFKYLQQLASVYICLKPMLANCHFGEIFLCSTQKTSVILSQDSNKCCGCVSQDV